MFSTPHPPRKRSRHPPHPTRHIFNRPWKELSLKEIEARRLTGSKEELVRRSLNKIAPESNTLFQQFIAQAKCKFIFWRVQQNEDREYSQTPSQTDQSASSRGEEKSK